MLWPTMGFLQADKISITSRNPLELSMSRYDGQSEHIMIASNFSPIILVYGSSRTLFSTHTYTHLSRTPTNLQIRLTVLLLNFQLLLRNLGDVDMPTLSTGIEFCRPAKL